MNNMEQFKKTKKFNYRMSMLAMIVTQGLLFSFNMSALANTIGYITNMVGWIVIGGVLECAVAVRYGVSLNKK